MALLPAEVEAGRNIVSILMLVGLLVPILVVPNLLQSHDQV